LELGFRHGVLLIGEQRIARLAGGGRMEASRGGFIQCVCAAAQPGGGGEALEGPSGGRDDRERRALARGAAGLRGAVLPAVSEDVPKADRAALRTLPGRRGPRAALARE